LRARLYWFSLSHPAHAVRRMLELKGVEYELATVLPGTQRVYLRLVGFRGGTVPALRLDDRRVQGSRSIARALEAARPDPPLFPTDEAVERWGDEELQHVPRRLLRWGLTRHAPLRTWISEESGVPAPAVAGALGLPAAWYYARAVHADEAAVRRALAELPGILERVDALIADGVLTPEAPDAATLQVLCSVRALGAFADLQEQVGAHPCAAPARALFPDYPSIPAFLPVS
jgi:glutathione S-transferase